jgi:hypothetical protein
MLGFMEDFPLSFDNNKFKRDLHIGKLNQRILGSFRLKIGLDNSVAFVAIWHLV